MVSTFRYVPIPWTRSASIRFRKIPESLASESLISFREVLLYYGHPSYQQKVDGKAIGHRPQKKTYQSIKEDGGYGDDRETNKGQTSTAYTSWIPAMTYNAASTVKSRPIRTLKLNWSLMVERRQSGGTFTYASVLIYQVPQGCAYINPST